MSRPTSILFIRQGEPIGSFVEVEEKEQLIGRGDDCDLRIVDRTVSRLHCRVWSDGENCWVEDLRSTNGTLLNRSTIRRARLRSGDELVLGCTRMQFLELEDAARAVADLARAGNSSLPPRG